MTNTSTIEGYLYQHKLEKKVSGSTSKNPGTEYITGTISIATDDAMLNVIPIHFTYVTATTKQGSANATFEMLNNIVNGTVGTVMSHGIDKAAKLRVNSTIGLNEFYTERNGVTELVSAKRNEGGFIHTASPMEEDEKKRNEFRCDILITNVTHSDANEQLGTPDKAIIHGYIFDFRNSLLPVEFSVLSPGAIAYYEGLGASQREPVLTQVRGYQVSETIVRTIEEESAWGDVSVREVRSSRKDFVVTWGAVESYDYGSEDVMTDADFKKGLADRELYLATIKQRNDEYKASKTNTASAFSSTSAAAPTFNF